MVFDGSKPWHGLGFDINNQATAEQMMRAAKCDWSVSLRPLYYTINGRQFESGRYSVVRDLDGKILDCVTSTFRPMQNLEMFEFFKAFAAAGDMEIQTAGSFDDGKFIWALAKCRGAFTVGKFDEIVPHVLIISPHVRGTAVLLRYTPIRVGCWNTIPLPLGLPLTVKAREDSFSMPHTKDLAKQLTVAAQTTKLVALRNNEFKAAAYRLMRSKADPSRVHDYFMRVSNERRAVLGKTPSMVAKFKEALEYAPGQRLATAKGTWWGALHAVTYIIDHEHGRNRQTALKNAWLFRNYRIKRNALLLALGEVK